MLARLVTSSQLWLIKISISINLIIIKFHLDETIQLLMNGVAPKSNIVERISIVECMYVGRALSERQFWNPKS